MKKAFLPWRAICLGLLFIILLTSCGSGNGTPANIDLTATADQATQIYLCSTAAPPTLTPSPAPNSSQIVLFRGNPERTGVYAAPAMRSEPQIRWQTRLASTLLAAPLVADGLLYTVSWKGTMYALDIQTGSPVWSAEGLGQHENAGAIAGDMIISGGLSKKVRARDRRSGTEIWTFETKYPVQGAPLIVGQEVYIATDREVYALALHSGNLIWQAATGDEEAFMAAPAFKDGLIFTTSGKLLLALDSQTGEEIWRVEKDEMFLGLAVSNDLVYVGNWNHYLYAFDRRTGQEHWQFQGSGEFWSAPAVNNGTVYAGNNDRFYALNAQNGELLWSFQAGGQPVSEGLVADGVVYFSDSNHEVRRGPRHLYALDATTGEELWVFETTSTFLPAPAVGNDALYVISTGEVIALQK